MEVSTALRRIKRDFGDEYSVVIVDQDIYDWMHDAELDIIRANTDNDLSLSIPANKFPVDTPNSVNIKRVGINGISLNKTTFTELDLNGYNLNTIGYPAYWYFEDHRVGLYPAPVATDTYNVDVLYVRIPDEMYMVAPYLAWKSYAATTQYATVETDADWASKPDLNLSLTMVFNSYEGDFNIFTMGTTTNNNQFHCTLAHKKDTSHGRLDLWVCDGTTVETHTLYFKNPIKVGELVQFRVTFEGATNTAILYKSEIQTGVEVLQSTSVLTPAPFNKNTTAAGKLWIGNIADTNPPTGANTVTPLMNLWAMALRTGVAAGSQLAFKFDGKDDLSDLPAAVTTFISSTAHTVTTFGGLVIPGENKFTVPAVYHEDIIKYCLAKAHNKNQNFKAAEIEMEQYDRRVSTRRNEAQATETALYKVADPFDYVDSDYYGTSY